MPTPSLPSLKDFSYTRDIPTDLKARAQLEANTLSTWDRQVASDQCSFFINGTKLSDLAKDSEFKEKYLKEKIENGQSKIYFKDLEHLKTFFRDYLFKDMPENNKEEQDEKNGAVEKACYEWAEAALVNSTAWQVYNLGLRSTPRIQIKPAEGVSSTEFESMSGGVKITETHHFNQWQEQGKGKSQMHQKGGTDKYYASTQSIYLFKDDGVELLRHDIKCDSKNLSRLFTGEQQHGRFMKSILKKILSNDSGPGQTPGPKK